MAKIKKNPIKDRDLHTQLRWPALSWSSISSFGYDKEKWYQGYVLGVRTSPNAVMQGGIDVGERITQDPKYLPTIERPEVFEQEFFGKLGKIQLMGHLDGFSPSVPAIDEYKTSCNSTRWTQKAVDEWGQITFYCLLVWLNHKIPPEKLRLRLYSIPMIENGTFGVEQKGLPKMFTTKRSMKDILNFSVMINKTYKLMEQFAKNHD